MSWLKEFILWASDQNWTGLCTGQCCKNKWEAAVIINSFKKHNIQIDTNLIIMDESEKWAIAPTFSNLKIPHKNLVFEDILDEIKSLKKTYLTKDFTVEKSGVLKVVMRLFFFS